jgi:hypothetical protein
VANSPHLFFAIQVLGDVNSDGGALEEGLRLEVMMGDGKQAGTACDRQRAFVIYMARQRNGVRNHCQEYGGPPTAAFQNRASSGFPKGLHSDGGDFVPAELSKTNGVTENSSDVSAASGSTSGTSSDDFHSMSKKQKVNHLNQAGGLVK